MFVPAAFRLEDAAAIDSLIAAHSFALLVTAGPDGPAATPLPLLHRPDERRLYGHLAAANPQCDELRRLARDGGRALAVFSGPHAYVSPSAYRPGPAVPTWNYLAVQVSGPLTLLDDARTARLLDELTAHHEAGRAAPWSTAGQDAGFLERLRRGVLGFALETERVEGKAKLSQNRPAIDRAGVAASLEAEPHPEAQATAAWMRRLGIA